MTTISDKARELLACPFCGHGDQYTPLIHPLPPEARGLHMLVSRAPYYGHCNCCGADGPGCDTEAEAVAAWNTRPAVRSQGRGEEDPRIAAVRRVIEYGYQHMVDGRAVNPLKNGEKCEHGRLEVEDCIGCYDEALLAALDVTPGIGEGQ